MQGYRTLEVENIEQLEVKIEQLIESHERIKKEKEMVEKQLLQMESELKVHLRKRERERGEIRQGIEKILGHFARLGLP